MDIAQWFDAVATAAAVRRVRRMQPMGGNGEKIFPPTYPGDGPNKPPPRHVFEYRRIGSANVLCVLIDSVQSQANRLEEALGRLRAGRRLQFPTIAVTFESSDDLADVGVVDTLLAPHRVFDAIIRDSTLAGKPFGISDEGRGLDLAKPEAAARIYELSPSTLIFGAWNSTRQGGGLGAKFPRAVVSEIVGIGVAAEPDGAPSGRRTGSRIDPLGIRSGVKVVKLPDGDWRIATDKDKGAIKPSEINHSNIAPSVTSLGVSVDFVRHSFVLSLPALRRLRFLGKPGQPSKADAAAHAALAALALAACLGQDESGYALRSRCDLVPEPEQSTGFELVQADGSAVPLTVDLPTACTLFSRGVETATTHGLTMRGGDLILQPQDKLLEMVRRSRQQALRGEAESEGE
ncbi:MAG: type I-U CRISPR-associated RAMP protein Csb1/Cas7u [Pirellulaceae bacterium]